MIAPAAAVTATKLKRAPRRSSALNTILSNSSAAAAAAKRKAAAAANVINVSMLKFVQLVRRTCVDATVGERNVDDDTVIVPYIEELKTSCGAVVTGSPSKRVKTTAAVADSAATDPPPLVFQLSTGATVVDAETDATAFEKLSSKAKRTVYMNAVNALFVALDRVDANLQFSREHLKYFLATHQRCVTVSDFVDTNRLKKCSVGAGAARKQKTTLHNGAILVEYSKSPYLFASNLSRCESTDVEAVRFIVQTGMSVTKTIYRNIIWRLDDVQYTVADDVMKRPDHVRIPILNYKRAAVMICESVVLLYDGNQFVLPTQNIERDITASMIASAHLKRNEHIVLDVLLANKLRVIDIITANKENFTVPEEYAERLQLVTDTFHNIKTVSLDDDDEDEKFNGSYIEKSRFSHVAPVYIHYKSNHTLAAVGMQNNTVRLAYQDDDGNLVYRLNTINSGPASLVLNVVSLQDASPPPNSQQPLTISLKWDNDDDNRDDNDDDDADRTVQILGLDNEPDVRLFTRAIRVELKDGNKLGSLSRDPITNVREDVPKGGGGGGANGTAAAAATSLLSVNNLTTLFNDPGNFGNLIKAISRSTQFEAIFKCLQTDSIDLAATTNLGY